MKRYIDDYFVFLLSKCISGERLLTIANGLNDNINFILELPNQNQLPFLDTMVSFNPESKTVSTKLHIKPIHSRCITPWDSHGPIAAKRTILIGETKRAVTCSTDSTSRRESLRQLTDLFVNNGYPKKFVKTTNRNTLSNKSTREDEIKYTYLKLPFINEEFKRRALAVVKRSGIDNVRIQFMNGKSSRRAFAPPRDRTHCPKACETCKCTNKVDRCLNKNVVYKIKCSYCEALYIGETGRTIGTRIKEHLMMKQQTVYKHLMSHKRKNQTPGNKDIQWRIIYGNLVYEDERKCIEAMGIQKHTGDLMNGCTGRTITT